MASETQSFEMFFPDTTSKKNEKTVIFTKKKLILLIMVTILFLGILLTPIYVHLSKETKKLTKIIGEIEEIKIAEQILLKEKMDSKDSFAHFLKAGEFGYFQKLSDKMNFNDGQAACQKIHGKIIESDERYGNATSNFYYFPLITCTCTYISKNELDYHL